MRYFAMSPKLLCLADRRHLAFSKKFLNDIRTGINISLLAIYLTLWQSQWEWHLDSG